MERALSLRNLGGGPENESDRKGKPTPCISLTLRVCSLDNWGGGHFLFFFYITDFIDEFETVFNDEFYEFSL